MPWVEEAMKDVVWLRKASGSRLAGFDPEMSEWGNLWAQNAHTSRFALSTKSRFLISKQIPNSNISNVFRV